MDTVMSLQALPPAAAPAVAIGGITLFFINKYVQDRNKKSSAHPHPPEVAGLPLIGNLLQLKEKKPHKTFTKWAETYGPVYSIWAGSNKMVVLNSNDVAKEAMVTKYSSISNRKLSKALMILSADKSMVALCDYNEFYKTAKRHLHKNVLGPIAQKRHRPHRDLMVNNINEQLHAHVKIHPFEAINFKKILLPELFGLALKQAIGEDLESIYVKELGATLSRDEIVMEREIPVLAKGHAVMEVRGELVEKEMGIGFSDKTLVGECTGLHEVNVLDQVKKCEARGKETPGLGYEGNGPELGVGPHIN